MRSRLIGVFTCVARPACPPYRSSTTVTTRRARSRRNIKLKMGLRHPTRFGRPTVYPNRAWRCRRRRCRTATGWLLDGHEALPLQALEHRERRRQWFTALAVMPAPVRDRYLHESGQELGRCPSTTRRLHCGVQGAAADRAAAAPAPHARATAAPAPPARANSPRSQAARSLELADAQTDARFEDNRIARHARSLRRRRHDVTLAGTPWTPERTGGKSARTARPGALY